MTLLIQICALSIATWGLAKLAGWLRLPPLLGMIVGGILVGSLVTPQLAPSVWSLATVSPYAREAVLAVVLMRAGLGVAPSEVRRAGGLALGLGLIPMLGDAALVTLGGVWLLGLPPAAALALGFLVAAISPAIVIPGMLELLQKRPEGARRVPTALLAGAPLDNIAAVVGFGIALDVALASGGSWTGILARVPYSVGVGALVGVAGGLLLSVGLDSLRRTWLVTAILWLAICALIPACRWLGVSYVLAVLALAATLRARLTERAETLSGGLSELWSVAQLALFGLIGAAIDLGPLAGIGLAALGVILLGQLGRASAVFLTTVGARLTVQERSACILAYLPKATIQAAFAGVALDRGLAEGQLLLSTAVLAIAVLAPVGVVALHRGADRLLPLVPLPEKSGAEPRD